MTDHAVAELLGMKPPGGGGWHARLLAGLPVSALKAFERKSGLNVVSVRGLVGVPVRPRTGKVGGTTPPQKRPLPLARSERLYRLARLTALATHLFAGDRAAAAGWLGTPAVALSGDTPLERSRTFVGARQVEDLIGRLEHGVFS